MLKYARFRFCPNCGNNRIEGFRGNGMQCLDCGFLYFHNCASAAAGIIETEKGILFTVRAEEPQKGYYDLPGGFVNYGESLEQALFREAREELNLTIHDLRYLGSFPNIYAFHGVTYFTTDTVFVAKTTKLGDLTTNAEISRIVFAEPHEIDPERIAFESIRAGLVKYLEILKG